MFCYQCEQTKDGTGCTTFGVCGKDPISAALQDLLVHATKGVSMYAHRARQSGARDAEVDRFVVEALFTTVTNVNFDPDRLEALVRRAATMRDRARDLAHQGCSAARTHRLPHCLDRPHSLRPRRATASCSKRAGSTSQRAARRGAPTSSACRNC